MSISPTTFRPSSPFRAFGTQRELIRQQNPAEDHLLDPKEHLSAKRAIGIFTAGIGFSLVSGIALKTLFKSGAKLFKGTGFETNNILVHDAAKRDEMNIAQSFSDGISSLYRLVFEDKNQLKAFVPYLGSSIVGYLAGSAFQGTQETWVRREETKIRAHLITRLQNAFRQSIKTKQGMDNNLKEDTQKRIYDMLLSAGIPNAHDLVVDMPAQIFDAEALKNYRDYFYQPTHRQVQTQFGALSLDDNAAPPPRKLVELAVLGAGLVTGFAAQGLTYMFRSFSSAAPLFKGEKVVYETLQAVDKEAWWINGVKNPKNMAILGGFLALSAGAKLGKLFVDGVRQVEVTRVNANTELAYQKHNWLSLDPTFHQTAETEAVSNDLRLLSRDLVYLYQNPALLRSRIQSILGNIGRNSAPKYFPMTPPVGLVDARS